jgi:DNA-binding NtrC family response regulator
MTAMDKKHVLMIDNDRFSLSVLQQLIAEFGYEPLIGTTADAAKTLLESPTVKVIVFNQDLEAEWGLSFLDFLRTREKVSDIPVILMSQTAGRYGPRIEDDGLSKKCFQKPIAIEPFVEHFRQLIGEQDTARDHPDPAP